MSPPSEEQETIPLDGETVTSKASRPGYFFSKTRVIAAVLLLVLLLIIVIVLAVLLGIAHRRTGKEEAIIQPPSQDGTIPTSTTIYFNFTSRTTIAPTTAGTEPWWQPRLPTNIVPQHYDLFLNITVDQPNFDGYVHIRVDVKNATDLIILHSRNLNMQQIEVQKINMEGNIPIKKHFSFPKYDYYVIMTERILEPARYIVRLSFDGLFQHYIGMYRQYYTRLNGEKVNFVATQFEDREARRAFPCFDEPALKATFNVTIAHRPDYVALSNMPIYKTEMYRHQRVNHYSRTNVVMPTYLLAFVVGDFNSTERLSSNDIKMRYYSRPSFVYKLDYAKSVGGRIMTYFEDLFNMTYPLPKEDMVGIPKFPYGGMENWGLILYNDNILLWDPKESTEQRKLLAVHVIVHELVHMWFGNIVTLNWWNDIWLNEGFAKIFEPPGVGSVEPDWKKEDLMIYKEIRNSMLYDVQASSNPLSEDVHKIQGTMDMSGVIFYDKGMCILRMIQGFIGEKTFMDGMKVYLKKHKYGNAVTDDVWKALTEVTCSRDQCMDIKQIMDPWTLQSGFPVVKFSKKNATHYTVTQSHFKSKQNETYRASQFGYSWVIPLSYVIKGKSRSFTWMNMTSAVIEWDGEGWIKANTDHKGYYVTSYDESNWLALANQLKRNHTVFSSSDRAGMLLDLYQFLRDEVSFSTLFTFIEYMENEAEYVPWRVLFDQTEGLFEALPVYSRAYKYLLKYLIFLGKKQYDRLGFQDTGTGVDKVARQYFLEFFCGANVKTCTTKAYQLFRAWMEDPTKNAIPPNLRKVVYFYGVSEGGLEEWEFLYSKYNETYTTQNKEAVLYGLAASKEPWIIERFLSYLLHPGKYDYQAVDTAVTFILEDNPIGNQIAWGYIRANWQALTKNREFPRLLHGVITNFRTEYRLQEVQSFQNKTGSVFKSSLRSLQGRIQWLKDNEQKIETALETLLKKHNILIL